MPETPEELYARVAAAADADGRLPLPDIAAWETFPWEGVSGTRPLRPPVAAEPAREGENGAGCGRCADPDRDVIWSNETWAVISTPAPTGAPLVLWLMPREHLDFTDLDDEMASECGRITVWLTRIIEAMPGIARCQVFKVGDGAEHLHVWFMARPERVLQLRGSFLAEWDDILPPGPEDVWRADLAHIAEHLTSHDGHALI